MVKNLSGLLVGEAHRYFDNFFNSVKLKKDLLMEKNYARGTASQNRKNISRTLKREL